MTRDELLAALTAEQHNGLWWSTRKRQDEAKRVEAEAQALEDTEIAQARRRRALLQAWADRDERAAQ